MVKILDLISSEIPLYKTNCLFFQYSFLLITNAQICFRLKTGCLPFHLIGSETVYILIIFKKCWNQTILHKMELYFENTILRHDKT